MNKPHHLTTNRFSLIFILVLLGLASCRKDDVLKVLPDPYFTDGVFICNEGPFQAGTGTVSFYRNQDGTVENDLYEAVNGISLGNIVQSMEVIGDKGFIIVNNANKIEVVNSSDFSQVKTIGGLVLPRFIIAVDERRAFISCWDNTVAVLNLLTLTVERRIPAGNGPERLMKAGDKVLVLNQGGFGIDSTITVIDVQTETVTATLPVYPKPTGIVADGSGQVWVMCSGKGFTGWPAPDDTEGHLLRIDPVSLTLVSDLTFPGTAIHPEKLETDATGENLYYSYAGSIYRYPVNAPELPEIPLISYPGYIYAMGVDKRKGLLYFSDPVDFVQRGWVFRCLLSTGARVDSFPAGIIPGYFSFTD